MAENGTHFPSFQLYPLGDNAVVLQFGDTISPAINETIRSYARALEEHPLDGLIEWVPGYTTLTLFYDPWLLSKEGQEDPYQRLVNHINSFAATTRKSKSSRSRLVEIPVCYGGDAGPDLEIVARHNSISPEEVVALHSQSEYRVYMIGFAPGFPYLGGMNSRISAPRKDSPRLRIPAGSVGIAGGQTGIYPIETPGGWQLIGRTPLKLFNPAQNPPTLLQAGDRVRFILITEEEYRQRKAGVHEP